MVKNKKNNVLHITAGTILMAAYFQLYWHYWLVKLLKGWVINSFVPILFLFFIVIFSEFVSYRGVLIKRRKLNYLLILLFYYLLFASLSVFLNEDGFDKIKSYIIYIYSPVMIFISILGLKAYKRNEDIVSLLKFFFVCGIILSIYVVVLYQTDPTSIFEMEIETKRGTITGNTGGTIGIADLFSFRYAIPGMSSNTYGALLVPLILSGLYFVKTSIKHKYIYSALTLFLAYCLLQSISRGALVSLMTGMAYIMWRKWFSLRMRILIILAFVISIFSFSRILLLRMILTAAMFFPIDVITYIGYDAIALLYEERFLSVNETISYVYQHPMFGIGLSNLSYLQAFSYGKEHNNYLSIAASFGIPTLVFYILFVTLLFIMVHKGIKKTPEGTMMKDMGTTLEAGLLAIIVNLNFAPAEFHFVWVWFGLSVAWLRNIEVELSLSKNNRRQIYENTYT